MTAQPPPQGSHFWFLNIMASNKLYYYSGTWTPKPGATRLDMLNAIVAYLAEQQPETAGGAVTAFDFQPNELTPRMWPRRQRT